MIQINSLGQDIFNQFLGLNEINFRAREIQSIRYLIDKLNNNAIHRLTINFYDNFYVGYQIPQIGKEFDLLKFGTNYNINIELKSQINEDKIKKQLVKNKFYLNLLEQTVYYIAFAYDEENNDFKFYQLDEQDNLILISAERVAELLVNQEVNHDIVIDNLFSPSNYLVSPFNSTDRFLNKEYFLTQNQDAIKNNIINIINRHTNTAPDFISLTGSAGTGKTLLTYDIAHHLMQNGKEILISHCGQLNDGHEYLIDQGWKIIPIKPIQSYLENANFDVLILDEVQRIYPCQFNEIIEKIRNLNKICIFAFDGRQTLSEEEANHNIQQQIGAITGIQPFMLTDKIRTNKEIADFIKGLFNNTRNNLIVGNTGNIEIVYCDTIENAVGYIQSIDNMEWKVIPFTNSRYSREFHNQYSIMQNNNSHRVIGQEFDNVVITIDQYFSYDADGKIIYQAGAYYSAVQMLFQNITRVRRKLKIIIINNPIILQRCLTLLQT